MDKEPSDTETGETSRYTYTPEIYAKKYGKQSLGVFASLCNLAQISGETKSIIEAGCGPGVGTQYLYFITSAPCVIYAQDITDTMITLAEKQIQSHSEFNSNKNNSLEIISPKTAINVEKDNEEHMKTCGKNGKVIKLFEGNCESLPFEDNQFDVYISCLCLMVTDYGKSLKEAYRVLKPSGKCAIGIWGKRKEANAYCITEDALEKHGIEVSVFKLYSMGEKPEELERLCREIGFRDIQIDYTNLFKNPIDWDEKEYFQQSYDVVIEKSLNELKDEPKGSEVSQEGKDAKEESAIKKKIIKEIKQEIHSKLSVDKVIPSCNILCLTGTK